MSEKGTVAIAIFGSKSKDNRFTFKDHISTLCPRASFKLHTLRKVKNIKLLHNVLINSQFNYASVIWMFCHRQDYLKVEKKK